MQNRKEDFIEFMKTTKEKTRDWESRHLWTTHFFEYILLFLLVCFVISCIFARFDLYHTDADSARYMLSALVQSQAAIVAIVITLTLIAVQLTASAYSPRVIRIFMKNPDMWILLLFYGVSIFYGLLVLKMIRAGDLRQITFLNTPLEYHIVSAYVAGAFTFFMLFPYMWNIISLLKSENIINRLAIEITKDKILNSKEDPVQPIMDVIHGSIMKYNLETMRVGLKAVTDQVLEIIGPDDEKRISERFCDHLTRVGRLAISREDEDSTVEVIENVENFGKSTAGKGLEGAASLAAKSLGEVGRAAVEKELAYVAWDAAESLGEVGRAAVEKGLEDATRQAAEFLGAIGEAAAKKGLKDVTRRATWSRRVDGSTVVIWGFIDVTSLAAWSLGEVGLAAAKKGLKDATKQTAKHLIDIGKAAAEKGLEDATRRAAVSLAELTIVSEEVVKTVIQNYESELVKQDYDSFQKFMKIYEQELEKLRAEN